MERSAGLEAAPFDRDSHSRGAHPASPKTSARATRRWRPCRPSLRRGRRADAGRHPQRRNRPSHHRSLPLPVCQADWSRGLGNDGRVIKPLIPALQSHIPDRDDPALSWVIANTPCRDRTCHLLIWNFVVRAAVAARMTRTNTRFAPTNSRIGVNLVFTRVLARTGPGEHKVRPYKGANIHRSCLVRSIVPSKWKPQNPTGGGSREAAKKRRKLQPFLRSFVSSCDNHFGGADSSAFAATSNPFPFRSARARQP